jgi:hypothetical protein
MDSILHGGQWIIRIDTTNFFFRRLIGICIIATASCFRIEIAYWGGVIRFVAIMLIDESG